KVFVFGGNVKRAIDYAECALEADRSGQIEEKHIFAKLLDLANGKFREFRTFLPTIGDLQFRVMRMIEPFIEEAVEVTAGKFLDHGAKILGRDAAVGVAFEVRFDAAAIQF